MKTYRHWYVSAGAPAGELFFSVTGNWEASGFFCDDDGEPVTDYNGNTVLRHERTEEEIDSFAAWDLYAGGDTAGPEDRQGFEQWRGHSVPEQDWAELTDHK